MKVKINIDGGSRGNPGPGASAYVIKDFDGKILAQEGHFITYCTNNQAEYTALKLAFIKAHELGANELFIQSDSLLLVKQYLGEYKIKNPQLALEMTVLRALAKPFSHIHIEHVLRHFNKEPDALANKAMDARQSVGFNPIQNMNVEALQKALAPAAPKPDGNVVNGVRVKPVLRDEPQTQPAKAAKKPAARKTSAPQPDLFEGF